MHILHKRDYLNDIGKLASLSISLYLLIAPKAVLIIFILIFRVRLLILLLEVVII
jgi:hypothetical protein